jgi:hypothetical protein
MDACGFDKNNPDDVSAFIALTTQGKFASMEDVEAFVAAREVDHEGRQAVACRVEQGIRRKCDV